MTILNDEETERESRNESIGFICYMLGSMFGGFLIGYFLT